MSLITGTYLFNQFKTDVGATTLASVSPPKASAIFDEAFFNCMRDIFVDGKQNITNKDKLSSLVNTNVILFPFVNNAPAPLINNQFYVEPLSIINVTSVVTTNTVFTFITFLPHNYITNQNVIIQGVQGFSVANPNGYFPVTVIDPYIFTITVTGMATGAYTPNTGITAAYNGQVYWQSDTSSPSSPINNDYWRFMACKAQIFQPLSQEARVVKWNAIPISIASMSGNSVPIVFNTNFYSDMQNGDNINITGILGNTNANGNFYIKRFTEVTFGLYTDKTLQNAVIGNGAYVSGGILSRIYYKFVFPLLSDEKQSPLSKSTPQNPKYESANSLIKIKSDYPVQQVTLDYLRRPFAIYSSGFFIDCTDNTINLENYYPIDFLNMVVSTYAKNIYNEQIRDSMGVQISQAIG
jgi:hypothetical protein